jgi:hypothetical protein
MAITNDQFQQLQADVQRLTELVVELYAQIGATPPAAPQGSSGAEPDDNDGIRQEELRPIQLFQDGTGLGLFDAKPPEDES